MDPILFPTYFFLSNYPPLFFTTLSWFQARKFQKGAGSESLQRGHPSEGNPGERGLSWGRRRQSGGLGWRSEQALEELGTWSEVICFSQVKNDVSYHWDTLDTVHRAQVSHHKHTHTS